MKIDKLVPVVIVVVAVAAMLSGYYVANYNLSKPVGKAGTVVVELDSKMWGMAAVFTLHGQPWKTYAGNFTVPYGNNVVIIIFNYDDMAHGFQLDKYNIKVLLPAAQDVVYSSNNTNTTIPSVTTIGPFVATVSSSYECYVPCDGMVPGDQLGLSMTVESG